MNKTATTVIVFFRHGDRTPAIAPVDNASVWEKILGKNANIPHDWESLEKTFEHPVCIRDSSSEEHEVSKSNRVVHDRQDYITGKLTPQGLDQMKALGQELRKFYGDMTVRAVHSTNVQRTIQSVESVYRSFTGRTDALDILVHSNRNQDPLLYVPPEYKKLYDQIFEGTKDSNRLVDAYHCSQFNGVEYECDLDFVHQIDDRWDRSWYNLSKTEGYMETLFSPFDKFLFSLDSGLHLMGAHDHNILMLLYRFAKESRVFHSPSYGDWVSIELDSNSILRVLHNGKPL